MEALQFFFKGIAAGFVVAAPMGPVAVLCIRRTMASGLISGCTTGLGAVVADLIYAAIAAYGIAFLSDFLFENEIVFRLVGGVVLCAIAVRMFRADPRQEEDRASGGLAGDFASALVITATNPITLVAFGVVFATIGVATAGERFEWAEALVAGVFVGASGWWLSLAGIAALARRSVGTVTVHRVNLVSAVIVLLCGTVLLIGAVAPESTIGRLVDLPG